MPFKVSFEWNQGPCASREWCCYRFFEPRQIWLGHKHRTVFYYNHGRLSLSTQDIMRSHQRRERVDKLGANLLLTSRQRAGSHLNTERLIFRIKSPVAHHQMISLVWLHHSITIQRWIPHTSVPSFPFLPCRSYRRIAISLHSYGLSYFPSKFHTFTVFAQIQAFFDYKPP